MFRRTRSREIALQILYMCDQNPEAPEPEFDRFIARRIRDPRAREVAARLVDGIRRRRPEIDATLTEAADNWRVERMALVDRNILRIGVYELLDEPDIPNRVAINEALELAKRYSTSQSSRFVNGVLDKVQADRVSREDRSSKTVVRDSSEAPTSGTDPTPPTTGGS